jgi:hypothetical protein
MGNGITHLSVGTSLTQAEYESTDAHVGGTGRTATYVIAASDAPAHVKAQADYVCDGTADNVEIQAAIDAIEVQTLKSGEIKLVGHKFVITAPVTITYRIWLHGEGSGAANGGINDNYGATILEAAAGYNNDYILFADSGSADNVYGSRISDLRIQQATTGALANNNGINLGASDHVNGVFIDHVSIAGLGNRGITTSAAGEISISECRFASCRGAAINLYADSQINNVIISNCGASDNYSVYFGGATTRANGIYVYTSTYAGIKADGGTLVNFAVDGTTGCGLWITSATMISNGIITDWGTNTGLTAEERSGIYFTAGADTSKANNVKFGGGSTGLYAVTIKTANQIGLANLAIDGVRNHGIVLEGAWYASIIGCSFNAIGQATANTYDSIYMGTDGANYEFQTVIMGNNFHNGRYSINTVHANTQESIITNNEFVDYGTKAVNNLSSTNLVRNNIRYIAPGEVRSVAGSLTAGVANAIAFAWHNPEAQDILIKKVVIEVTTPGGTALSVLQVGIADDATGTNLGTEFFPAAGIDLNSAAIRDSWNATDTGVQTKYVLCQDSASATDGWIVGKILTQNASSLVGSYYVEYSGR